MKIFVLHDCVDSSDFYAESNILMVTNDRDKAKAKMFELYLECRSSYEVREISKDESWCNDLEALAVDTMEERMFYDILSVKKMSFHLIDEMNKS